HAAHRLRLVHAAHLAAHDDGKLRLPVDVRDAVRDHDLAPVVREARGGLQEDHGVLRRPAVPRGSRAHGARHLLAVVLVVLRDGDHLAGGEGLPAADAQEERHAPASGPSSKSLCPRARKGTRWSWASWATAAATSCPWARARRTCFPRATRGSSWTAATARTSASRRCSKASPSRACW